MHCTAPDTIEVFGMDVYRLCVLLTENVRGMWWVLCLFYLNLSAWDDPVCLLGKLKEAFKGKTNRR